MMAGLLQHQFDCLDDVPGEKQVNGDKEGAAEETEEVVEEDDEPEVYYDKSKSFFDNISCDATSKAQGWVLTSLSHF